MQILNQVFNCRNHNLFPLFSFFLFSPSWDLNLEPQAYWARVLPLGCTHSSSQVDSGAITFSQPYIPNPV